MEEKVKKYILSLDDLSVAQKNGYIERFVRNADIMNEFGKWIDEKKFPADEDAIKVDGYSADKIKKMGPVLEGIGVYNFLVDLRENPEDAKKAIEDGFVVR